MKLGIFLAFFLLSLLTSQKTFASVLTCVDLFQKNQAAENGAWKKISSISLQKPEWQTSPFATRKTRLLSLVDAGELNPRVFLDMTKNLFSKSEQELLLLDFLVLGDPWLSSKNRDYRHKFLSAFQAQVTFERDLLLQALGTPWFKLLNLKDSSVYIEAAMDNDVTLIRALREAEVEIDINAWVYGPISKYTALTAAIEWGHIDVVRELLLFPEIDTSAKDPSNPDFSAIQLAKDFEQFEIILLLLKHRRAQRLK